MLPIGDGGRLCPLAVGIKVPVLMWLLDHSQQDVHKPTASNLSSQGSYDACRGWGRLGPLAVGLIVPLLMWLEGSVSSMCINPARAFGPALMTGVWDNQWVFWTAPFLGGIPAGLIYTRLFNEKCVLIPAHLSRRPLGCATELVCSSPSPAFKDHIPFIHSALTHLSWSYRVSLKIAESIGSL